MFKPLSIAKRNTIMFFRDKASVFFSVLSAIIIILLYVLFLRDVSFSGSGIAIEVFDVWIMAGMIGVTTLTACLGALEVKVNDESHKIIKDFISSPIQRKELVFGYILSALTIGFIVSVVSLVFAQAYVLIYGGGFFGIVAIIKAIFIILLSVFCGSSLMFFLVSFIKTTNAFGIASTIMGTLVGFVSGAYFPINMLPEVAQGVVKILPVSHSVMLLRSVLMKDVLAKNILPEDMEMVKEQLGIVFKFGDFTITPLMNIAFILVVGVVFFSLGVMRVSKKRDLK